MTLQNFTQKSQEAIQDAQNLAIRNNHQQLEQIHLLAALLEQEGGLIPQLLKKMDVTVESLSAAAMAEVRKLPGVTGAREADKIYISNGLNQTLVAAQDTAQRMKDDFVSVEHLFLALLDTAEGRDAGIFTNPCIKPSRAVEAMSPPII